MKMQIKELNTQPAFKPYKLEIEVTSAKEQAALRMLGHWYTSFANLGEDLQKQSNIPNYNRDVSK